MFNFLICGLAFWLYAFFKFRGEKILYPSVIFSFMWGWACLYTALILGGYGENLYLKDYYKFEYVDEYVVWFTIAVLSAFLIVHALRSPGSRVESDLSEDYVDRLLHTYKWVLWLNFFGGLLRMAVMLATIGFDSVMDYRTAANAMMMTSQMSFAGIVFKITAYIQMLANFYIALAGLKAGLDRLSLKGVLFIFILYAPNQMATGGRLFILYFILFFFGAFVIGRGLALREETRKLFESAERRAMLIIFGGLLSLVAAIAMARYATSSNESKESPLEKFSYVTEGMLCTEYLMKYYPPGTFQTDGGKNITGQLSRQYLQFRGHLQKTRLNSCVVCLYTREYLDFGYWGSLVYLFIFAFLSEFIALNCLRRMSLMNFLVFITVLKLCYESVMSDSIPSNIPVYELLILFAIFRKPIFDRLKPA